MNEFKVSIMQPVVISGNFQEMRQELATMMTAYADLEVTEDNIPERKKDIATLRKIKTAIEDKRKETKRDYEKPFKSFEAECKSLTGIIDEQISRINADLNQFEQKRVKAEREAVRNIYNDTVGDFSEYLPIENIYRPQWDNKSYSEKDIAADIQTMVINVRQDLNTIDSMCAPWADECKLVYMANGNSITSAIQRYKDLQSAKEAAERAVKAAEQETHAIVPEEPAKPTEKPTGRSEWTFTVYTEEDAQFIRDTCDVSGVEYKEG